MKKNYDKLSDTEKDRIRNKTIENNKKKLSYKIYNDFNRLSRLNKNRCIFCFYFPDLRNITLFEQNCQICQDLIVGSVQIRNSVCFSCSAKYNVCLICHGEIEG